MIMEMRYCMHCGHKLDEKYLMGEGMVPYCPECREFRFPIYNTAVSMIVMNKELDKILLIKQYGRDSYILVAGYVNKGEDAEDAVIREIREEMDLKVLECHFNRSHYFAAQLHRDRGRGRGASQYRDRLLEVVQRRGSPRAYQG